MRDWNYCPRCQAVLAWQGELSNPYVQCPSCDFIKYDNPLPTTIGVIHSNGLFLFMRRASEPELGKWDAVGGFLAPGERAEDCLFREAREEIGCSVKIDKLLGTYASVYGDTGFRTLGIGFLCSLTGEGDVLLSAENDAFSWFPREEIPELAFGDVRQAVQEALRLV
jgi:ADP-ribose pyrophosphatase